MLCLRPLVVLTTLVLMTAAIDASGSDLQARRPEHPPDSGARSPAHGRRHSRRHPRGTRAVPAVVHGRLRDRGLHRELSRAIVARPGWTVVVFPQIPLGNDPANTIGARTIFPGSYPVRMATLRAIYMDLASELGDQGFRWIFLVHNHGAPNHHKALNQASDYFHDTYGGTMVHLFGLKPVFLCCGTKETCLSKDARAEEGFTVHAGADEHSQLFFLRPDLIAPDFAKAPSSPRASSRTTCGSRKPTGGLAISARRGSRPPRWARRSSRDRPQKLIKVALQILDGLDPRTLPRYADEMDPLDVAGEQQQLDSERAVEQREQAVARCAQAPMSERAIDAALAEPMASSRLSSRGPSVEPRDCCTRCHRRAESACTRICHALATGSDEPVVLVGAGDIANCELANG